MPTIEQMQAVMTGTESTRIKALRRLLAYPVKEELDPEGSRFWYLRPGEDKLEAADTLPIAVGFFPELNQAPHEEILKFLTSKEQPSGIYEHYISRANLENKPIMYILLPQKELTGRVALILPTEGGLRQRQIQTFAWDEQELLGRLSRLEQGQLPIALKALNLIPLVEWVFYPFARTSQELAQELAKVTRRIEQAIPQVYDAEDTDGYLHELLVSFQRELLPNLNLIASNDKDYSFADIYAQTIAYGLFTARVFSYVKGEKQGQDKETYFNREEAWQSLPETNPFLRRLFQGICELPPDNLGKELLTGILEIFGILRAAKMNAILLDFRQKMNREDIVIRFYEDFLEAYKPKMRERRGVYYTPEPIVSYMVRSVDELLKDKFNKPLGLADSEVMILDPACGTGTFLLWICQLIYQRFQETPNALTEGLADKSWSGYVKERLLPRIFGFELLMAPYAIAHLKLGLFLEETGYKFDSGKRLGIYLTNTLDGAVNKSDVLLKEFIANESNEASEIKQKKPIMVVVGNPPYSISSANNSTSINLLMSRYKKAVRSEKNIQPLNDDYIKFMCFAHHRIEQTGYGILAFITNNSYLQGLIHRGIREELLNYFDNLYITDLHGNSLIQETPPINTLKDNNVFDIKQGVAITITFRKKDNCISSDNSKCFHSDVWGTRESKYEFLNKNDVLTVNYKKLTPSKPNFFFYYKEINVDIEAEYQQNPSIIEIFNLYKNGIQTGHDDFATSLDKSVLESRIQDFFSQIVSDSDITSKYNLKDKSGWNYKSERNSAFKEGYQKKLLKPFFYRPFEYRWIYYSKRVIKRPVKELMQHLTMENLALVICRQQAEVGFRHVFVSDKLGDCNAISIKSREFNYYFPLYLHINCENQLDLDKEKVINLSIDIFRDLLGYTPAPEAVFYYIYAIFHSPIYRTRYAEFLKIDFPRVPLTSDDKLFRQLAIYGEELVALHLMKSPKLNNLITEFKATTGNCLVDTGTGYPKFVNKNEVVINKKGDKFISIPENVWNFYVGGYQVCQKWLKDRKGTQLNGQDIQHYQCIVVALQETIKLMDKIDQAIPQFPIK